MRRLILLLLVGFIFSTASVIAAEEVVEIKRLGVSPWFGPYKTKEELATKFASERGDLARYVQFDFKKAIGLDVTWEDAQAAASSLEANIPAAESTTYKDGDKFLSMGWKDRNRNLQRTGKNVLKRGKDTSGLTLRGEIRDYEFSYFLPFECGNPFQKGIQRVSQPRAEAVPQPKVEIPPSPQAAIQPPPPSALRQPVAQVVDVCPNIEGIQTTKPEGLVYEGGLVYDRLADKWGNCVIPPQQPEVQVVEKIVYVQNSVMPSYPTYTVSPRYDYQPTATYQPGYGYTNGSGGYSSSDALVGALVGGVAGYALGSSRRREKNTVVVNVDNHNDIRLDANARANSSSNSFARNDNRNDIRNDNRNDNDIRNRFDGRNDVIVVPDRRRDDRRDDRVIFPPVVRTVSPVAPPVVRTLGSSSSWSGIYTPYQGSSGTYAYRGATSGNRNGFYYDDRRGRGRGSDDSRRVQTR